MSDAANQKYPEPFQIVSWRQAIEDLNITIIAGGSSEVEDPERFFEAIIFKSHSLLNLITKCNQNQRNYYNQIHIYEEKCHCLFYLNSWISVPDKSKQENDSGDFQY